MSGSRAARAEARVVLTLVCWLRPRTYVSFGLLYYSVFLFLLLFFLFSSYFSRISSSSSCFFFFFCFLHGRVQGGRRSHKFWDSCMFFFLCIFPRALDLAQVERPRISIQCGGLFISLQCSERHPHVWKWGMYFRVAT